MKYNQGECYAITHWYNVSVLFFEDTDKEVTIECSVQVNEDDNTDSQVINVNVINPEDNVIFINKMLISSLSNRNISNVSSSFSFSFKS